MESPLFSLAQVEPEKLRAAIATLQEKFPPEFLTSDGRPDYLKTSLVIHDLVASGRLILTLEETQPTEQALEAIREFQASLSATDIQRLDRFRNHLMRLGITHKDSLARCLWYLAGFYLQVANYRRAEQLPPLLEHILNILNEVEGWLIQLADYITACDAIDNRKARRAKGAELRKARAEKNGEAAIKAKAHWLADDFKKRNRAASKKRIANHVCERLFDEAYKAGVLTSRENAPDTIARWLSKR